VDVYLRLPMPYLVAALLGPEAADGSRKPAPYTVNQLEDGKLMHRVAVQQLLRDANPLGQLAADGHDLLVGDERLKANVVKTLVYSGNSQPPFSSLDEAVRAFTNEQERFDQAPYVGDTVVDVLLRYPSARPIATYRLSSTLNPGLAGQLETANLLLDYGSDEPLVHRITGLLHEPVVIDRSAWTAAKTFIVQGVLHILGGYDHVLFVACLVLGSLTFLGLAWRITGFTIGHSITLSAGFFGYTPAAVWFIPLVETGIALSIIYAALLALTTSGKFVDTKKSADSVHPPSGLAALSWGTLLVTSLIGMLHGLGFSIVLQEILGISSPNIWTSLLSFNIGVELGQLGIVLLVWPLLLIFKRMKPQWHHGVRWAIALPCIAVASLWTGERLTLFLAAWQAL